MRVPPPFLRTRQTGDPLCAPIPQYSIYKDVGRSTDGWADIADRSFPIGLWNNISAVVARGGYGGDDGVNGHENDIPAREEEREVGYEGPQTRT